MKKIAVVDTDCHHGDGTQDIYWHDPDVLYISIHQDGRTLYPGSGFPSEFGGPKAAGYTINIPLPPLTGDEGILWAVEHVVLPVLEDFGPDLVINSAGQDNHFTDPITNMSFSALGYARLNELLKPHVCVLEGGYSIEGALPYVNTGIILALAGLDYSYVREPDYDPERVRQDPRVTEYIQRLCEQIYDMWRNRSALAPEPRPFYERSRSIFYDTDSITERQHETLAYCTACNGALRIDSRASTGYRILAVHLPRGACSACRSQAREWFDHPGGPYYAVYLQDLDADEFTVKIM
mgnify:FL=1